MQLVDLALPGFMLELPHPLLADDVDFHRAFRRTRFLEVNQRAPGEEDHADAQRDERPSQFQRQRAFNLYRMRMSRATVLDGKDKDEDEDEQREKRRHRDQQEIKSVHLPCHCRGTFRKEWEVLPHICQARPVSFLPPCESLLCESRRNITIRNPPRISMVAAPAIRMMLEMTALYRPVCGS